MTITFDGTASTAFNALCFRVQTDNASVRQYDTTVVLGKNGNALFDRKRFPNETNVYYVVFRGEDAESDYSAFKNYVLSREGYKRLEDSEHPYEFYMAYVSEPIDPTVTRERDMIKCVVTFSRLPQRFLKSGEIPLTITPSTHTVTNDVVVIDNSAGDKEITNLSAAISPIQDLNGYDHPWPAGGGKNLFYRDTNKTNTVNGVTGTFDAETQTISIVGTNTSSSAYILLTLECTGDIPREVALARTLFNAPGDVYINLVYRKNGVWVGVSSGGSIPAEIDTTINLQIGVYGSATSINATNIKAQIELGSAPTTYAPFSNICPITGHDTVNVYVSPTTDAEDATVYTKQLGQTVYGGTVDLVTGVLTVDRAMVEIKNAYRSGTYNPTTGLGTFWYTSRISTLNSLNDGVVCNRMITISNVTPTTPNGRISWFANGIIRWTEKRDMSVEDYNAWLNDNPLQVTYKLPTPLTYQLSAQTIQTLLGTNNIWADAGDVTVTYVDATTFENPTYFSANPIIRLYGVGTLTLNGNQITITNADVYTDIDFETGECYKGDIDKNQYVSLSTPDFVPLKAGINVVSMSGITKIDVTPRWWQK